MANVFKKIGGVLATLAPTIATMAGGPLAGSAVGALIKGLGLPEGTTPDQIEETVLKSTDPATYAAIKKADQDYAIQLKEIGIDAEKVAQADRASAREREIQVRDKTPRNLAYLIIGGFFVFSATGILIYFKETLDANKLALLSGFIGTVLGYLVGESKQVIAYYFGSSVGSDKKTDLLNQSKVGES